MSVLKIRYFGLDVHDCLADACSVDSMGKIVNR